MVVSDTRRPFSSFFFDGAMIDLISLSLGVYPIRFVTNRLSCIQTYSRLTNLIIIAMMSE